VKWRTTGRKILATTPVFSLRQDSKERASGSASRHDFYILDAVDWVNVVPVTPSGEIVFIELYRHGIDASSLEIPGGMIDPEDPEPAAAAAREMREETGYEADHLVPLGVVHPNPAIQGNRCHTFLAENARRVGDPRPDETEDIRVVLHPRQEVPRLLREGRITHALVVAGLYWYLEREGRSAPRFE
jgi:8-oxo-dGTP pyrophosphatase MutT (NUDIX family)